MNSSFYTTEKLIAHFNEHILEIGLPKYQDKYFGRDSIVRYCIENKIEISTEKYPSPVISPNYKDFLATLPEDQRHSEEYEEYHNNIIIHAFTSVSLSLGYDFLRIYYECFEEDPIDRCYEIRTTKVIEFLSNTKVPTYFLDDTLFFTPDFKYGLCIFHHELLEFFGFGGAAEDIHTWTIKRVST